MEGTTSKINSNTRQISKQETVAGKLLGNNFETHFIEDVIPQLAEVEKPTQKFPKKHVHNPNLYCPPRLHFKSLDQIFEDFNKGHISFFGVPGSGKTTLLKTIARNTLEKKYEGLKDVELVIFLQCCNLDPDIELLPVEHLLSDVPELSKEELTEASKILNESPGKVLFVLDALDTFPGNLRAVPVGTTRPKKKASAALTIFSLLQGLLYPGCRIITSTRDCASESYKFCEEDRIIGLAGFTTNDIYSVVCTHFERKEANTIMQEFQKTPFLLVLCQIPVFLVFTLLGRKYDASFTPTTMSQVLVILFENFIRSKHAKEEEVEDILRKLQPLAFKITCEGKISFSTGDLAEVGLDPKVIKDFSIVIPGGRNDKINCFIHQSIQEMLATFHIAGMSFDEFCEFTTESINQPKYRVLHWMLSGILCDLDLCKKASYFFKGDDLGEKRKFLQSLLQHEAMKSAEDGPCQNVLALVKSLYEARDGAKEIIRGFLRNISLKNLPYCLSKSDLHIIGTVLVQCEKLELLAITNRSLLEDGLVFLHDCITGSDVEISRLDMSFNFLSAQDLCHLGQMARECKTDDLAISGLDLTRDHLHNLKIGLSSFQLKFLDISYHPVADSEEIMLPENRSRVIPVPFKPQVAALPDDLKPFACAHKITLNISMRALWTDAPYDLVHSISDLFTNVSENLLLYGWKINKFHQDLLQWKLDERIKDRRCATDLKVLVTEATILSGKKPMLSKTIEPKLENHAIPYAEATQKPAPSVVVHHQAASDYHTYLAPTYTEVAKAAETLNSSSSMPEKIPCVPNSVEGEEFWEKLLGEVNTIEEFRHFYSSYKLKTSKRWIYKFQIGHQPLSSGNLKELSRVLQNLQWLNELELRRCHDQNLFHHLKKLHCKISTLSVTAVEEIDSLIPAICDFMSMFQTEELNVEESHGSKMFLSKLLKKLVEYKTIAFHKLDLSYNKEIHDFPTLGKMLCIWLTSLKLVNCDIKYDDLKALKEGIGGRASKLEHLDLSYNTDLTDHDVAIIPQILRKDRVKLLALCGCDLYEDEMEEFDKFSGVEIERIELSYNTSLFAEGLEIVGRAMRKLKTKQLALAGCELDEECLDVLLSSTEKQEVSHLDIKGNTKISSRMAKVAKLVRSLHTKHLDISECRIGHQQIHDFLESLEQYKLKKIDISDSERNTDRQYVEAVCKLATVVDEELVAIFPNCDEGCMQLLLDFAEKQALEGGPRVVVQQSQRLKKIQSLKIFGSTH